MCTDSIPRKCPSIRNRQWIERTSAKKVRCVVVAAIGSTPLAEQHLHLRPGDSVVGALAPRAGAPCSPAPFATFGLCLLRGRESAPTLAARKMRLACPCRNRRAWLQRHGETSAPTRRKLLPLSSCRRCVRTTKGLSERLVISRNVVHACCSP